MKTNWKNYHKIVVGISEVKNPTVLGFSAYFHDSSACIIEDGKIVAAAEEERFSRKKHDNNFPVQAIKFCLKAMRRKPNLIVFFENPDKKFERIKETLDFYQPSDAIYKKIFDVWDNVKSRQSIQKTFTKVTGLINEIIFLDHHLAHAASSYYVSGYSKSAIVTIDGVGEKTTTTVGVGANKNVALLKQIEFPHSIGLLYTALTVFLGFTPFEGEYKVMGLSSYGDNSRETNPFYKKIKRTVKIFRDGSFVLDMQYFGHDNFEMKAFKPTLSKLLGIKPRQATDLMTRGYENLAAALQLLTEDLVMGILNHAYNLTGSENLCFSGGVALNSIINAKIISKTNFKNIFIQPAAGDSGSALGAAKYVQVMSDKHAKTEHMSNSYFGPAYNAGQIENYLKSKNIPYTTFGSDDELIKITAELLKNKEIIGWFQGKMEWGPRSLGNRSILASPLYKDMKDILNEKVKHREMFRPFAPAICIDDTKEYFECDKPIPEPTDYMIMVYSIKKGKRKLLPAVTHVDGSGRLQTVRKDQNKLYYNLIKKFGEITGVPILVNTSFNVNGEPIVCSPQDAIACLKNTAIDYLVMDKFLIRREDLI